MGVTVPALVSTAEGEEAVALLGWRASGTGDD
jgi:hypothetical protein